MEHTSESVDLGKHLHDESYPREKRRELEIDNLVKIDYIDKQGILHDIKYGTTMETAHIMQICYYLYLLKQKGVSNKKGIINYPRQRQTTEVELTPEREKEVGNAIEKVNEITACLTEVYRTQLNPTISFLHEPGDRRFSLSLDLAEIFKPLIIDRIIFRLFNRQQLNESKHFETNIDGCYLNEKGRKLFIPAFDEQLKQTVSHRKLKRHVSYQRLIRLECYKLIKHLVRMETYQALRPWW